MQQHAACSTLLHHYSGLTKEHSVKSSRASTTTLHQLPTSKPRTYPTQGCQRIPLSCQARLPCCLDTGTHARSSWSAPPLQTSKETGKISPMSRADSALPTEASHPAISHLHLWLLGPPWISDDPPPSPNHPGNNHGRPRQQTTDTTQEFAPIVLPAGTSEKVKFSWVVQQGQGPRSRGYLLIESSKSQEQGSALLCRSEVCPDGCLLCNKSGGQNIRSMIPPDNDLPPARYPAACLLETW